MTSALLYVVGAVLVVAGVALIGAGWAGRAQVRRELSDQRIRFPAEDLPANLTRYAGTQVGTGPRARAFAGIIAAHVAAATKGRTYAEITDEWQAGGRTDDGLRKLREMAFMGNALRGALLGAYQAWLVAALVAGLGALFAATGVAFVALGVDLRP